MVHSHILEGLDLVDVVELVLAFVGVAMIVAALAANQGWLDRHFLPSFFLTRHAYVVIETAVRAVAAAAGLSIALVGRKPIARLVARRPSDVVRVAMAAILALVASEIVLTRV